MPYGEESQASTASFCDGGKGARIRTPSVVYVNVPLGESDLGLGYFIGDTVRLLPRQSYPVSMRERIIMSKLLSLSGSLGHDRHVISVCIPSEMSHPLPNSFVSSVPRTNPGSARSPTSSIRTSMSSKPKRNRACDSCRKKKGEFILYRTYCPLIRS